MRMDDNDLLSLKHSELQRMLREAFLEGCVFAGGKAVASGCFAEMREERARTLYPIRKKVPRVVEDADGDYGYRVVNGDLQARYRNEWSTLINKIWMITPERIAIWSDLLANPFEYIEE